MNKGELRVPMHKMDDGVVVTKGTPGIGESTGARKNIAPQRETIPILWTRRGSRTKRLPVTNKTTKCAIIG
jgi:hypothetical protein